MKSQSEAAKHLWFALGDFTDWFARLGGAARYPGFRDEEIPIAILILLQPRFPSMAPLDGLSPFLSPEFWDASAPVTASVRKRLEGIEAAKEEDLKRIILDFTSSVSAKLKKEEMRHWPAVLAALSSGELSPND